MEDIMDMLMIAKDIAINVLVVIIILYVVYKSIRYVMNRRFDTIEVLIDGLYNYDSYIKIDSNLSFLKSRSNGDFVFNKIYEKVITEEVVFARLIDKYIKTGFSGYKIFCEFEKIGTSERKAEYITVKMSILGNIKALTIEDKTDYELEFLKKM